MRLAAGFVRVSTGSQDERTQVDEITEGERQHRYQIVKWFKLHGYSASKGEQEPALRTAIEGIAGGEYELLVVTDSSRLDRREDLDAQASILLAVREAGGDVLSLTEPGFGKTDFAGRIVTLVAQHANAEKSRTVKNQTWRGIQALIKAKAHHGTLPMHWESRGPRYAKQAVCTNPEAVRDAYQRLDGGEPLAAVARVHDVYPAQLRRLVAFDANWTGLEPCHYTHQGEVHEWMHEVDPPVDAAVGSRVRKLLRANAEGNSTHRGGRPLSPGNWLNGVLDCPACGGQLYLKGQDRKTLRLRCCGRGKARRACGVFRPVDAQPVIDEIEWLYDNDQVKLLSYQRVSGNRHELDALEGKLAESQAKLATAPRAERRELLAAVEAIEDQIEAFVLIPDVFDYAETSTTVGDVWTAADTTERKRLLLAAKKSGGLVIDFQGNVRMLPRSEAPGEMIDLGNGFCFRRPYPPLGALRLG